VKYLFVFDKNKLLILKALYNCRQDVCGCDLVDKLKIPKNLVSYHMRILREKGLIRETKCGNRKVYKLYTSKLGDIQKILAAVHLLENYGK